MKKAVAAIMKQQSGSFRGEFGRQNPMEYALRFSSELLHIDPNQRCRRHRHLQGRSAQQTSQQLAQQRFVSGKQDLRFGLPAPDLVPDASRSGNGHQSIGSNDGPGVAQYLRGYFCALDRAHIGAAQNERGNHTSPSRPLENLLHFCAPYGRQLARRIGCAGLCVFGTAMAQQMKLHSLIGISACKYQSRARCDVLNEQS